MLIHRISILHYSDSFIWLLFLLLMFDYTSLLFILLKIYQIDFIQCYIIKLYQLNSVNNATSNIISIIYTLGNNWKNNNI